MAVRLLGVLVIGILCSVVVGQEGMFGMWSEVDNGEFAEMDILSDEEGVLTARSVLSAFAREIAPPWKRINEFADWLHQTPRSKYLDCPTNEKRFGLVCDEAFIVRDDLDNYFCGRNPEEFGLCGQYWKMMWSDGLAIPSGDAYFDKKRGVSNGALPISTDGAVPLYGAPTFEDLNMYLDFMGRVCSCHCGCAEGCFPEMYRSYSSELNCGKKYCSHINDVSVCPLTNINQVSVGPSGNIPATAECVPTDPPSGPPPQDASSTVALLYVDHDSEDCCYECCTSVSSGPTGQEDGGLYGLPGCWDPCTCDNTALNQTDQYYGVCWIGGVPHYNTANAANPNTDFMCMRNYCVRGIGYGNTPTNYCDPVFYDGPSGLLLTCDYMQWLTCDQLPTP